MSKFSFISILMLIANSSFAQDVVQIDQLMEAKLAKIGETPIQYECTYKSKDVVPDAKVIEKFPDGTVSFTAPHIMNVNADMSTESLVIGGAYLNDDGKVYQKTDMDLKVTQFGKQSLVEATVVNGEDLKRVTHWLIDGSGAKVLVERFTPDGIKRSGTEKSATSSKPLTPRFQSVYQLPNPSLNPSVEKAGSSVIVTYSDSDGKSTFTVDPTRNVVTRKTDKDEKKTREITFSNFSTVGEFDFPAEMVQHETDKDGGMIKESTVSNWKFKVLTSDEARGILKLEFPEGTTVGQQALMSSGSGSGSRQ